MTQQIDNLMVSTENNQMILQNQATHHIVEPYHRDIEDSEEKSDEGTSDSISNQEEIVIQENSPEVKAQNVWNSINDICDSEEEKLFEAYDPVSEKKSSKSEVSDDEFLS